MYLNLIILPVADCKWSMFLQLIHLKVIHWIPKQSTRDRLVCFVLFFVKINWFKKYLSNDVKNIEMSMIIIFGGKKQFVVDDEWNGIQILK